MKPAQPLMANRWLLAFLLCLAPHMPSAQTYTGNSLLETCSKPGGDIRCGGYVRGVVEAILAVQETNKMTQLVCIPPDVTFGQVYDLAMKYLLDHPESQHYTAASTIMVSLRDAFPCQKMI